MGKTQGQNRNFWESARINNATFRTYFDRLTELSISMFKWENLPETIDERFLELALFGDGKAVFFLDEDLGYLALRCMVGGVWNVYNIPTDRTAYASNGYQMRLDPDNSVLIYNNMIRTNSTLMVELYSRRLWDVDRTIDINVKAQKTPIFIQCSENQRLTLKNLYMKYEGNEPFIFGDKSINLGDLKVLSTNAPYVADKLYMIKTQIWNEALTYLGISNINITKKERLITDEVQRNQGGTLASRLSRLKARQQACEQINKMFGLDIWCDYNEEISMAATEAEIEEGSEDLE